MVFPTHGYGLSYPWVSGCDCLAFVIFDLGDALVGRRFLLATLALSVSSSRRRLMLTLSRPGTLTLTLTFSWPGYGTVHTYILVYEHIPHCMSHLDERLVETKHCFYEPNTILYFFKSDGKDYITEHSLFIVSILISQGANTSFLLQGYIKDTVSTHLRSSMHFSTVFK